MQGDDIGLGQALGEAVDGGVAGGADLIVTDIGVVNHHVHAKGAGARRHFSADPAEPGD